MWCEHCSQEVPGVARPGNRQVIVCPRCDHSLLRMPHEEPADSTAPSDAASVSSVETPIFEDDSLAPLLDSIWEQQAWAAAERDADRLLRTQRGAARNQVRARIDDAHGPARSHLAWSPVHQSREEEAASRAFNSAKLAVFLGACGILLGGVAVVLGESVEQSTWRISGMVAAAVSQLMVATGVVGLLMAMWRMNRVTRDRISQLDRDVAELQQQSQRAADYRMDETADTLLLVDNMRRQLERLAERVRNERAA